jgi:hypothetical protein
MSGKNYVHDYAILMCLFDHILLVIIVIVLGLHDCMCT